MSTQIDTDAIVEAKADEFDWSAFTELIDRIELAGDGIVNESSCGPWCDCWECRI